ncbi:antiviral reverse transcriptase Drt3a, partial [Asticcacaulis benevestitus]
SPVGVPRGIGISAYLCEIYMRSFDEQIKAMPHVLFYARYVDDIIIVAYKPVIGTALKLFSGIKDTISKYKLSRNKDKTHCYSVDGTKAYKMDFLGYTISFGQGTIKFNWTQEKLDRYKSRIDLTINAYLKNSKSNEKKARNIFLKRARFLTSNTRLHNNKRNSVVGIYFSNTLLTEMNDLVGLDFYYQAKLNQISNASVKAKAAMLSFKDAFETKLFSNFSEKELAEIVKAWKNAA